MKTYTEWLEQVAPQVAPQGTPQVAPQGTPQGVPQGTPQGVPMNAGDSASKEELQMLIRMRTFLPPDLQDLANSKTKGVVMRVLQSLSKIDSSEIRIMLAKILKVDKQAGQAWQPAEPQAEPQTEPQAQQAQA